MQNVKKPEGDAGIATLERMNKGHTSVSLWSFEHLDIKEDDVILDVGCGGGINLKRLHQKTPQAKTYGIDYSSTSVEMSKKLNQEEVEKGNVIVEEADVQDLPFNNETFDIVTACETVYFWPDLVKSFKEIRRVLKPEGLFVIILTTNGDYDNHFDKLKEEVDCEAYNDIELRQYLTQADYSSMDFYIRQLELKKELIKRVDEEGYSEILVDDTFVEEDVEDDHHDSPEWLCVVAKK